jgi:hypothetical protein
MVIKSERMSRAGYMAHGNMRNALKTFVGKLKDLGLYGRITLEWILEKWSEKVWIGVIWLRIRASGGLL